MERNNWNGRVLVGLLFAAVVTLVAVHLSKEKRSTAADDVMVPSQSSGVAEKSVSPAVAPVVSAGNSATNGSNDPYIEAEEALSIGVRLASGQTFAEYVANLEAQAAHGDTAAMVKLATLLQQCARTREVAENKRRRNDQNDDSGAYYRERLCGAVSLDDPDRPSKLVGEAAMRGDEEAIINGMRFPPRSFAATHGWDPQYGPLKEWIASAINRLAMLADKGNPRAALALGGAYSTSHYGQLNLPKAATYLRQGIKGQPLVDMDDAIALHGTAEGERLLLLALNQKVAYSSLPIICGKIRPDSVAPGVCK